VNPADSLETTFRGRRVLVTGHNGFKGSWLTYWLHRLGASVVGISLEPEPDSVFVRAALSDFATSHIVDIRDGWPPIESVVQDCLPDLIIHMAAQPLVLDSFEDPYTTFNTNVMGTANVVEAIRQSETAASTIVVTTDKVYARSTDHAHVETDPLGGGDPYSLSKAASELTVAAWSSLGAGAKGNLVTARAGNVIGGGDLSKNRLLPDLIRAFKADRPAVIRNPQSVRPWQHVLDPLYGYLVLGQALLERRPVPDALNFGPAIDSPLSVAEVAGRACMSWGPGASWIEEEPPGGTPMESPFLTIDSSLARQSLGWEPKWGAAEAIERTVNWWRCVSDSGDAREAMRTDVRDFEQVTVSSG
jgi:CDP-glucose 4,6-dehydratase